jgi:hypothetical protein
MPMNKILELELEIFESKISSTSYSCSPSISIGGKGSWILLGMVDVW